MGKLKSVGRYIMEDRTLGKGNFAVVEMASHIITNSKVAVKIIDRRKLHEEYMQNNLYREAKIMSKLRHPNVARLYETIKSNNLYFLVTEYVAGGDLLSFVRNQKDGYLSESRSRVYVRQLVSALHHLHERGVVHRDLKMENIILDAKRKNLKLIDFGLSNQYTADQLLKTHCGSPEYAAPELFVSGREYGPEVDIWSLGIIAYAMVTGKLPFTAPHTENRRQRLLQQINAGLGPMHERDMKDITEDCKDLLRRSIRPSESRIHLMDIQIHPWITSKGKDTFYTFQQPPRDPQLREAVLEKMASLLHVERSTLDGNIHENRCDEIGAIFNLLMDDALREKGLWEGDHTRRRDRSRRSSSGGHQSAPSGEGMVRSTSQTPTGEHPVRLRTPTIVGMVRPSDRLQNGSPLQSADFELSIVESEKQPPERPRTATFPPSCLYTRPMGNATTVNIILARQQHFPGSSTPPPQVRQRDGMRKDKHRTRPKTCIDTPETHLVAPHPSSAELPLNAKARTITSTEPPPSEGTTKKTSNEPATPKATSNSRNHQSAKKEYSRTPPAPSSKHPRQSEGNENKEKAATEPANATRLTPHEPPRDTTETTQSVRKLQVVDMSRYFNAKHGYQVSETPFAVKGASPSSQGLGVRKSSGKSHTSDRRASLNLCDTHLAQLQQNDLSKEDSSRDRRHSIAVANISEKSPPQRSATPVQLRLHHRETKPSPGHPDKEAVTHKRRTSPSPLNQANLRRHSLEVSKNISRSQSSGISSYVPSRSHTPASAYERMTSDSHKSRPRTSKASTARSLYKTPIASMIASDGNLAQRQRHKARQVMENVVEAADEGRTGMPPRPEWKRTSSVEQRRSRRSSVERERTTGYSSEGTSREVHQIVPDKTMRVHSAKIKNRSSEPPPRPPPGHVHQDQRSHRVSKARREHVTSTSGEQQKMLKYTGHHRDETKVTDSTAREGGDRVLGNFSTQGLLGVILAEPYSSKSKPRGQRDDDARVAKHGANASSSSRHTRQRYVNIAPFNFFDKSQLCNTTAKSVDVTKAPVIRPKGSRMIQVFDIQKSHDVTSVPVPTSSNSNNPNSKNADWGKTYSLERKVSDTLKGGNEIVKMRQTPEPVRDG